jgi:type II secretion system protein H
MSLPALRKGSRGFTLLELVLVLALIGLIVTLVAPRLGLFGSVALDTSARRLAARIRFLREEAALRGHSVRLSFDLHERSYAAAVLVPTTTGARFVDDSSPLFRRVSLPDDLNLDVSGPNLSTTVDGQPAAIFSPDGFADPTVIYLDDGKGRAVSIVIEPGVTAPRILDGYVDARSVFTQ